MVAETVTRDRRKLHHRSLSNIRFSGDAERSPCVSTASANADSLAVDPETGVEDEIEEIDDKIYYDKKEADHDEISGHDRDVDKAHGLNEHQTHTRPLEHGLGDNRKGNDRAELQAGDCYTGISVFLSACPKWTALLVSPRARANLM